MAQATKDFHQGYRFLNPSNGRPPRLNVYKRSLEARNNTNAYLAEVERKAAGVDEPAADQHAAHTLRLYKALTIGFAVLLLVAVGMWAGVMR